MKVWAYIHPQLNILCCAVLEEAIPEGIDVTEFDVETPDDVIFDGNQIRLKTNEEKLQKVKQEKLQILKEYVKSLLSPTDYVLIKIEEEREVDGDVDVLKQQYQSVINKRRQIRQWNTQMEQTIQNANTLEEINNIEIKFIQE